MRFRLLKIVSWLVVATVLSIAIGVAVLRVLVFTGEEKGHSSILTDRAIAKMHVQPNRNAYSDFNRDARNSG